MTSMHEEAMNQDDVSAQDPPPYEMAIEIPACIRRPGLLKRRMIQLNRLFPTPHPLLVQEEWIRHLMLACDYPFEDQDMFDKTACLLHRVSNDCMWWLRLIVGAELMLYASMFVVWRFTPSNQAQAELNDFEDLMRGKDRPKNFVSRTIATDFLFVAILIENMFDERKRVPLIAAKERFQTIQKKYNRIVDGDSPLCKLGLAEKTPWFRRIGL